MEKVRLNYKNQKEIERIQQIINASGSALVNYLVSSGVDALKNNLQKFDDELKEAFKLALKEIESRR